MTMQTALKLACTLSEGDYAAVTLAGGYAIRPDGSRYMFEACRVRELKRNRAGRCVRLVGTYYDGSTIRYTWSETRGPRYSAQDCGPDARSDYPDNGD
jgi:hypothetical protein